MQDKWLVSEAEAIARIHGIMLAGAMEALNEWALEQLGGQLYFQDAEFLMVERTLLAQPQEG